MELDWRSFLLLALFAVPWDSWGSQRDPVTSVMWDYYHERLLDGEAFVFDERVKLSAPPFAEDARQVPIQIDASAFDGQVVRMLAWALAVPHGANEFVLTLLGVALVSFGHFLNLRAAN